jgi:hypothetical protein
MDNPGNKINNLNIKYPLDYIQNRIFNDLMNKTVIDRDGNRVVKYIHQARREFQDSKINSQLSKFDIYWEDLSEETGKNINDYIQYCNDVEERYNKLDGIMTEVIAQII